MNVLPMRKSEPFPSLSLADALPEYRDLCERRVAITIEIGEARHGVEAEAAGGRGAQDPAVPLDEPALGQGSQADRVQGIR